MNQRTAHPSPAPSAIPARHFNVRLTSTPRGARLARRLAGQQLADWGVEFGSDAAERAALVVAELAANAITHGHTRGRDFRLALRLDPADDDAHRIRIEVTDTRPDRLPPQPAAMPDVTAAAAVVAGRGLVIVHSLATAWGVQLPDDGLTKTVWAELRADQAGRSG
ncbi:MULTISPECIES: ATP-binding protein [unclassified Streptomyces]|uniref:ATP-binding protein n=1 Tax=unclassified Streptomyces TaxID=2593676 RepID=UPI00278C7DF3|nr:MULTISPECIES: ATP-binding protein [unclassified Streptomyces]